MEQASSAFSTGVPALAAIPQLAGNSRQGFGLVDGTMRWASGWVISSNTLGIKGSLYDGDAGSRSTGKERDAESGNDYFGARYYASNMGRFMSPDPLGNFVADVSNPQTWNMYAYALNNPLKFTDPTGYDCAYLNNAGDGIESLDQNSNSSECTKNGGYWADGAITNFQTNSNGGYTFTSLDANLNTLTTNFSGGGNAGSTSSLDVMSYFFNYQIQQRQLQQSQSLWSMSPEQRFPRLHSRSRPFAVVALLPTVVVRSMPVQRMVLQVA